MGCLWPTFHSSHVTTDPKRASQGKYTAGLIEEEGLDEDGQLVNCRYQQKRKRKQVKKIMQQENDDGDKDGGFLKLSSLDELTSDSKSNESDIISNDDEVCSSLRLLIACYSLVFPM